MFTPNMFHSVCEIFTPNMFHSVDIKYFSIR